MQQKALKVCHDEATENWGINHATAAKAFICLHAAPPVALQPVTGTNVPVAKGLQSLRYIAYSVKSRLSRSRPQPPLSATPRSCPLAFHTFAYHLLGGRVAQGVKRGACQSCLSPATLAAPHSVAYNNLQQGPRHFRCLGTRLLEAKLLTISCHFLHFLVHCFQFFTAFLYFLHFFTFFFAVAALKCAALSRATYWHLQTVAATAKWF